MTTDQIDPESARLLAELEAGQATREQLEDQAKALRIKFNARTTDDVLRERIAEATAAPEAPQPAATAPEAPQPAATVDGLAPFTVTSNCDRPLRIHGVELPRRGATVVVSVAQQGDARLMMKINHAIKLGLVTRGAD